MTDLSRRVSWSSFSFLACLAVSWVMFSKWGPTTDLKAYGVGSIALLFALIACALVYPYRRKLNVRIFLTLVALLATFWSFEVFGGLAWYGLDKWVRHRQ